MQKHPLDSKRLRQVPTQFSWVDHRLVRRRLLSGTSTDGWALYLFLVSVADELGLSYYSARSICEHLGIDSQALSQAQLFFGTEQRKPLYGALVGVQIPAWQNQ